ncbi:MAG: HEAT repeat domain-containing protein [Gemmatimonadota bacterium]|nr:HEAT repeat domain-containing protein [Gemmatimonadota bacterium]MDH3427323.1 HEAT repeat domain-containing protein [Gemmatimonadota bacterium]
MNAAVLAVIAIGQAVFITLLLALLVTRRVVGGLSRRRGLGKIEACLDSVNLWLAGHADQPALIADLEELSFSELSGFLQRLSLQVGGEDWERLTEVVRKTSWFEEVRDRAVSRYWWRRLQATQALIATATPAEEPLVEALIRDEQPAIQRAAVWCLRRVQSRRLSRAVLDLAGSQPRILRRHILEVLAENRQQVLGPLVDSLAMGSSRDELRTSLTLAEMMGVPSLLEHVLPHASSEDLEVRISAARALAAYPHPNSSRALVGLLNDDAWQVRAQAATGLGAIGAREAASNLDEAITDPNWWVRLRSALALRRLGEPGVRLLEQRTPEPDAYAYEMARYVLGLETAAVAEYGGSHAIDFSEALASEQAA